MEWMHFWIALGCLLNLIGVAGAWWSDATKGWMRDLRDYQNVPAIPLLWSIATLFGTIMLVLFGFENSPIETWNTILMFFGLAGSMTVIGMIFWALVEIINGIINTLNRAEQKTREVIGNTVMSVQERIARNRTRREQLRASGKLRKNMKPSNVRARARGYHEENMEALPEGWVKAKHQLTSLYTHIDFLLAGRDRRGKDLAKAARDAQRHKNAEEGTPEHRAHLKTVELSDFFKGRRRALGALIREIEAFLEGIEHDIAKYRPDTDGEEKVLDLIAVFCKKHGIDLEHPPNPEEEDELLRSAKEEVDQLTAEIERIASSPSPKPAAASKPQQSRTKKQAGARRQRQGT